VIAAEPKTVAAAQLVARFLTSRGVTRVFGLQGGHIQPVWDVVAQLGIPIVDVRHEAAAVHMAHAHAELTGELGVALVTAGPGVTNTVTAIANASSARVPLLLVAGCAPRPQTNMGPLQEMPHVAVMAPMTRYARTCRVAEAVPRELDEAVARAFGDGGEPGPSYIEFPTDVLREPVATQLVLEDFFAAHPAREFAPGDASVAAAVEALWSARRPVVISGRGARDAGPELIRLLDTLGAVYLDTQESRGVVPDDHPATVSSLRATVMNEADLVVTVGRKLDYQLGYGSPAVFPNAGFVRIADTAPELIDNRRGDPEVYGTPKLALAAILAAAGSRRAAVDAQWAADLSKRHRERSATYGAKLANAPSGADGRMHPNRIFAAIRAVAPAGAIAIADGGDILSFARLGLTNRTYLDSGSFGCLGIGVPFAVAAALAHPERGVICVSGDGAFGFNAMEIDTAVRHGAKAVFIIANNAAWNIERHDQDVNYGGRIVGTELAYSDYAALGRALGAYGERVTDPAELEGALKRALANAPAVLDVIVTRDAISSDSGKGLGFVPAYQPLNAWDVAERRRRGEHVEE
jgi:acetolactate synthase I/II/III large subunit